MRKSDDGEEHDDTNDDRRVVSSDGSSAEEEAVPSARVHLVSERASLTAYRARVPRLP